MLRTLWLLSLVLVSCSVLAQQKDAEQKTVFMTLDKNNVPVFSDNPTPGSKPVTVRDQGNRMLSVTPTNVPTKSGVETPAYELTLTRPQHKETIRDNNGTVYVSGQVSPMFAQGLRVTLYLDNTMVAGPSGNANFILHNIDRGEHQLRMELLDENGKLIAQTPETTIYLFRASVNSPN